MEDRFRDPKLAINRVYTRQGDQGQTRLVGGQNVSKDSLRINAYGTVDELNAAVGLAREFALLDMEPNKARDDLTSDLIRVQHELFNLGSLLATLPEDLGDSQPRIRDQDVERLEHGMDACNQDLPPLRSFVLPGGSRLNAQLHVCRTLCRRAERVCVSLLNSASGDETSLRYLNRLSDAFFVWSRWVNATMTRAEILWNPNQN